MVDDLHELRTPACHDALGVVITAIPPGSQLVAASRSTQPHLPRLRAAGDAFELGPEDLALDAAAAQHIFSEAQVALTPDLADVVTARTEGWPAGLYLAALIAKESQAGEHTVAGDDRYVADYLYRESLAQLPERTQEFLRRTAVLDQLSGPLCDAVLGGSTAYAQLQELEAANLFLVPLDRRREWYRYHALFREFLLGELRRAEPDLIVKLHLRAADWYEANGSPALSLEHLLDTPERDRTTALMSALAVATYGTGQISTVQRWLSSIGDASVASYPPLAVSAGWIAALAGHTNEAQRWVAVVEEASFDLVPVDGTASFESARAMFRAVVCAGGAEQMLADAMVAVDQESEWSPWRDTALALSGVAHVLVGDPDQGRTALAEASLLAANGPNNGTIAISESELALLAMDDGQWPEAEEHLALALATIDEYRLHDYTMAVMAYTAGRASPCTAATWRGRTDSSRGGCGPDLWRRSCCLGWPCSSGCSWPRCTPPSPTSPPPGTCCARSTTSFGNGRTWARSSTRWTSSGRTSPPPCPRAPPAAHRSARRSCGCSRTSRPT